HYYRRVLFRGSVPERGRIWRSPLRKGRILILTKTYRSGLNTRRRNTIYPATYVERNSIGTWSITTEWPSPWTTWSLYPVGGGPEVKESQPTDHAIHE